MSRCPLPPDVDARRIGPFINRGLKKLGYNGPLTITAVGILSEVPLDVLRDLASTGIHLRHVPTTAVRFIMGSFSGWIGDNPPPANLMLISLQPIFGSFLEKRSFKYTILGPLYPNHPVHIFEYIPGCFPWESLLSSIRADAMDSNPGALEENEECSGTGESTFYCSACLLGLLGFGNFIRHLESKEHALEDLEFYHPEGVVAARECRSRSDPSSAKSF